MNIDLAMAIAYGVSVSSLGEGNSQAGIEEMASLFPGAPLDQENPYEH